MKGSNTLIAGALLSAFLGVALHSASAEQPNEKDTGRRSVKEWIVTTRNDDPEVRSEAAWMLGQIGPNAKDAVPTLTDLLQDKNSKVRECAAYALGRIGPQASISVSKLLVTIQDADESVRLNAMSSLGCIGPSASEALPVLIKLIGSKNWEGTVPGIQLIRSIGLIGGSNPDLTVPVLQDLLKDQKYRQVAIVAIGDVGPSAKAAIPSLVPYLSDKDVDCKFAVARTLLNIDPSTTNLVIPTLVQLLKHDAAWVRRQAAKSLSDIGPGANEAVPTLRDLLNDPMVKEQAAISLKNIDRNTDD